MKTLAFTFLALLVVASPQAVFAQSKTYSDTRKLLAKMDYSHLDANFKKLFEEAVPRKADLIHALYDDKQRVCLNAQIVMKFLADPEMLAGINEWFEYRKKLGKEYWYPHIELTPDIKYPEMIATLRNWFSRISIRAKKMCQRRSSLTIGR